MFVCVCVCVCVCGGGVVCPTRGHDQYVPWPDLHAPGLGQCGQGVGGGVHMAHIHQVEARRAEGRAVAEYGVGVCVCG